MSLRAFTQRLWPHILFPLLFFCLGLCLLPYPGLQNDEVLFANPLFHVAAADRFHIEVFHHSVPLMLLTYMGALKTWLYGPILALFAPTYLTVRLPALFLGAITIWLFVWLLGSVHGKRAAWIGGLLLATDSAFLLTTCFDWGPVALQHFLLVFGTLLVWHFSHSGARSALFWGLFCFGLGMWDKALFGWVLGGLVSAVVILFPREIWKRWTMKNVLAAAAGFSIGALPLLAYNFTSGFPTVRSNSSFGFEELARKAGTLRGTWNGSVLFGYLVNQPSADYVRDPQGTLERASFGLHSALGEHLSNRMEAGFYASLALIPWLWFTRARRAILFGLIALGVAWFQMAITKGAGAAAHHAVLLWPLPHFVLAIAFTEASVHLRKIGGWMVAAVVLYLAAGSLLVTNQYLYRLARYGPAAVWSDGIYQLSDEVGRMKTSLVVIDDWGMLNQLVLFHHGQLPLEFAGDDFLSPQAGNDANKWDLTRLQQGLWVGHTAAMELFAGANARIVKAAAGAGLQKEVIKVISDRHGRPTFEIFRFKKLGQLP